MTCSIASAPLALCLLLGLTAACDKGSPDPVGTASVGDSEDSSESSDSDASSTSEGGSDSDSADTEGGGTDTDGGSTTTVGGDTDTDTDTDGGGATSDSGGDDCGFLLEGMSPDEIADAWTAAQVWGEAPEPLFYCEGEHETACTTEGGESGTSLCVVQWGAEIWTECAVEHACTPDDVFEEGECQGLYCALIDGVLQVDEWVSDDPCCGTNDPCCWTPLVVNFDGGPIRFENAGAADFDISGLGACLSTDWPAAPWLALDRDGDGVIDSGRELFGSGTIMSTGLRAGHGFEALAEFDVDLDGRITAADPIFHELVLWSDHDSNRRGTLDELVPVASAELVAIDLGYSRSYDCDERGNCGVERAGFEFRDELGALRSGEVVDVHLPCQ
ncbi:MAG: hypothetical protein KC486_28370 [Myxococcales bacterium]|nr:hypothetical protein [Myxococcales bacterium]